MMNSQPPKLLEPCHLYPVLPSPQSCDFVLSQISKEVSLLMDKHKSSEKKRPLEGASTNNDAKKRKVDFPHQVDTQMDIPNNGDLTKTS